MVRHHEREGCSGRGKKADRLSLRPICRKAPERGRCYICHAPALFARVNEAVLGLWKQRRPDALLFLLSLVGDGLHLGGHGGGVAEVAAVLYL